MSQDEPMEENKFTDLYNKTGIPFQYWCLSVLRKTKNYQGISEFSFTHPPSLNAQMGKTASIDIVALKTPLSSGVRFFDGLVLFSIECKRADSKIKNWVFSGDLSKEEIVSPTYFLKIPKQDGAVKSFEHKIERSGSFPGLGYMCIENLNYCLHGVELNDKLTDINRNQNEIIYKSLLQANHALNALFCKFQYPFPHIENLWFPNPNDEKNYKFFFYQ